MQAFTRVRRHLSQAERTKRKKRRFVKAASSLTPYLVAEKLGSHFVVPIEVASKLFAGASRSEFVVLDRAVHTIRASGLVGLGGLIVDVGANIGTTTIPAVTAYGFDEAVAIEPDPDNARLLRANVALNDLHDRVEVIEAAASGSGGSAVFDPNRENSKGQRIGTGKLAKRRGAGRVEVELVSLDQLAEQQIIDPDRTHLVWMDVQGHEDEVILGAGELVRRRVPLVFAFRPRRLRRADELVALLEEHYTAVVDLRKPNLKDGWTADVEPVTVLRTRIAERDTTDFLVFALQALP